MRRSQYVILFIALFLLTALFVFPPRRYPPDSSYRVRIAERGFLFGDIYVERKMDAVGKEEISEVEVDYPRLTLEVLTLASATAFLSLSCRPRRYAE